MAESRLDVLRQVPLFAELAPEEQATLATALVRRHFSRGEVVFVRGDPGSSLYILESGRINIVLTSPEGKEIILALLGPSDFFGDLALLDGEPRSADAIAQEAGTFLLLSRERFLAFLDSHPRVAARLLAVLSRRLRRNAQLIQDAAFLDIPGRLARLLLELAADSDGAGETTRRLTQSELGAMIGATRESVNKWLRSFERQGLIRIERGCIRILDREALEEIPS